LKTSSITLKAKSSYQIFSQIWEPENPAKGVIILVHGLGEHSDRYCTHFANFFSNEGYSILAFDLPGHGLSSGKKGHIKEYDDFDKLLSTEISYA